ncbi:MAG: hypothetical protein R2941_12770 [Desulfobacterales bacterium]
MPILIPGGQCLDRLDARVPGMGFIRKSGIRPNPADILPRPITGFPGMSLR